MLRVGRRGLRAGGRSAQQGRRHRLAAIFALCSGLAAAPEWWAMDETASERLRAALEAIAEELADMGRARLSEAIRTDSTAAVAAERDGPS